MAGEREETSELLTVVERARHMREREPALRSLPPAGPDLLIALDIDGTLISHGTALSREVVGAIASLQERGAHVVFATGRPTYAIFPVMQQFGLAPTWFVCSNGAMIGRYEDAAHDLGRGGSGAGSGGSGAGVAAPGRRRSRNGSTDGVGDPTDIMGAIHGTDVNGRHMRLTVTDRKTFDAEHALRILREELPDAMYAVESDSGFKVNRPFPPGELTARARVVPVEELWNEPVSRLTMRDPSLDAQDFHDLMERVGLRGVGYAIGWTAWLDLSPEGITKAVALEEVRRRVGVAQDATVAMGDGMNDIDMVDWAACGVAMGDSQQGVLDVADVVSGTVADDGAAVALRALLGE